MIKKFRKNLFEWIDLTRRLNIPYFFLNNQTIVLSNSSLYYCSLSHRYISKHLLLDRISDCYYSQDEQYPSNLSEHEISDDIYIFNSKHHIYSRICLDLYRPEDPKDYFDSTNCQFWPCHNPYTRCDGIFQCLDGIDELGCSNLICEENEFKCVDYNQP